MTDKKVLTFQDISCLGQCSLTVALPVISACGIETVILPSAVLSTHTGGFTDYTFRDLTEDIPAINKHWVKEGFKFDCLYTGYLGSDTQIDYVLDLKESVINKEGLLIVDPVMGDLGELYSGFDDNFVEHMAKLCGRADIVLPNITEAALMTKSDINYDRHDEKYIVSLIHKLADLGAKTIVLKGISYEDNKIGVAVYDKDNDKLEYYFNDKQAKSSPGTGDCYASAFVGAVMQGRSYIEAAKIAADFVVESIKATADDDRHTYGVKFEKALPMLVNLLNK